MIAASAKVTPNGGLERESPSRCLHFRSRNYSNLLRTVVIFVRSFPKKQLTPKLWKHQTRLNNSDTQQKGLQTGGNLTPHESQSLELTLSMKECYNPEGLAQRAIRNVKQVRWSGFFSGYLEDHPSYMK